MKKIVFVLMLFMILSLTGCGEDSLEVQYCNKMSPIIKNYENKKISYLEFLNKIHDDYDTYCVDKESKVCTEVDYLYRDRNRDYTLEDCSKYDSSTELGKARKDLCESSNKVKQDSLSKKSQIEDAKVSSLKTTCELAKGQ